MLAKRLCRMIEAARQAMRNENAIRLHEASVLVGLLLEVLGFQFAFSVDFSGSILVYSSEMTWRIVTWIDTDSSYELPSLSKSHYRALL